MVTLKPQVLFNVALTFADCVTFCVILLRRQMELSNTAQTRDQHTLHQVRIASVISDVDQERSYLYAFPGAERM